MPADTLDIIGQMIDTISAKHVRPDEFQSAIEQILPKLTAFVREKDLVTLDPTKPLVVRKEPGYMAGVAGASMSSPGPYDSGQNAYFNVGSLSGWSPEKADSYLREYNQYMLQILCIHEAIPGHYVQLVHANKAPSMIKSIFSNTAMVEGWAVYGEQMMLDNGYDNFEPEMLLMWYKMEPCAHPAIQYWTTACTASICRDNKPLHCLPMRLSSSRPRPKTNGNG